jgi:3D (Asp-Asp-Asp) domain-containing protein
VIEYRKVGFLHFNNKKRKDVLLKKILAIGVSLLASCLLVFQNADNATLVTNRAVVQHSAPLLKPKTHRVRVLLTAYVPDPGAKTATGRNANLPGIAADFKLLPAGTKISIPGRGTFVVDDTGGRMRQDNRKKGICHLDLRVLPSHHATDDLTAMEIANHRAMVIGKRWIYVYVVLPHGKVQPA